LIIFGVHSIVKQLSWQLLIAVNIWKHQMLV